VTPAEAAPALPEGFDLALLEAVAGPIGIAISGGGDSTALAVLAAEALPRRRLVLLTVNHGLRADAADDVAAVERLGRRLGLPVVALAARSRPSGSVQAWARAERHQLLAEAAQARGLAAVALGHTLDDQAETFLLRLARGSGVRGLSAMRPRAERDGLVLLRPLLGVSRAALREALRARAVPWREDPSNADPRFDRTAMRALLPRLAAVGLGAERLAATAHHLARASDAVDEAATALVATAARRDRAGAFTIVVAAFAAAPREVRLRALGEIVQRAGGGDHPPRFDALARAEAAVLSGGPATTLGRAVVSPRRDVAHVWREARGIRPLHLSPGEAGVFDGRYRVALATDAPAVTVDAIGAAAARSLPAASFREAVATAPGIFRAGTLAAAPTLGMRARDFARGWVTLTHVR